MELENININRLTTKIADFEQLKALSEQKWQTVELKELYGFQIQKNAKWKAGLSESAINDFEQELGYTFSESLRNFYRTMNGLDKSGINIYGDLENDSPSFRPTFYSYPEDLEIIKKQINWILEANDITTEELKNGEAPYIFPIFGHRFLILDANEQVLSMHGSDIIPWADNLSKAIAVDIFRIYSRDLKLDNFKPIDFWL